MNIIIYGLGKGTDECEQMLKKEHDIIGYTDSFAEIKTYHGRPFLKPEDIHEFQYDIVVVTLYDLKAIQAICKSLVNQYMVPANKIIAFWYIVNHEIYRYKLETYPLADIEGIILENSHAAYGFLERRMKHQVLNLAVPSQDLYCEKEVLRVCLEEYGEKLKSLQYIVIDLYDYHVFNIDVSLGGNYECYLTCGGSLKEHYKDPYQYAYGTITDAEGKIAKILFNKTGEIRGTNLNVLNRWEHISADEPLAMENLQGKSVKEEYEQTVKENVEILKSILEYVKCYDKNINIFFSLLPRYISMERKENEINSGWKEKFYEIIAPLMKEYKIELFNYKNRTEISGNHYFWNDICHLNTIGAAAVTELLNHDLDKFLN